jgi:hypothetical protein
MITVLEGKAAREGGEARVEQAGGAGGLGWVALKAVLLFAVAVIGLRLGERRTPTQLGALVCPLVAHRAVSILRRRSRRLSRAIRHGLAAAGYDGAPGPRPAGLKREFAISFTREGFPYPWFSVLYAALQRLVTPLSDRPGRSYAAPWLVMPRGGIGIALTPDNRG